MSGDTMVGFGHKQAWLAVRDAGIAPVTEALGLRDLGPVSWRQGIDLAYLTDDRLAVTPPLSGARQSTWTLVAGRWLLMGKSLVDIVSLSSSMGTEVQFFASHRVGEAHRWERAVNGILLRAFAYDGSAGVCTDWRGDPDETEIAVGLPPAPDDDATILVAESDVMRIAGAWSVDPSSLDHKPSPGRLHVTTPE